MTPHGEAREALERLGRRNQLILESAGEGIFGLDEHGRFTFVNPAAGRMLGWDPFDLVGLVSHPTMHHTRSDGRVYPDAECPVYASFKDGAVHRMSEDVFWRKDGTSFPVEYVSTPIVEDGGLRGAVVVFDDITDTKS